MDAVADESSPLVVPPQVQWFVGTVFRYRHVLICVVGAVLSATFSVGVAMNKQNALEGRLTVLEQVHPEITRSITDRNASDLMGEREQLERMSHDIADIRVEVAHLVTSLELRPLRATEARSDAIIGQGAKNALARP